MQDLRDFLNECDRAPRLNQLRGFFADTAAGRGNAPSRRPYGDMRLLPADPLLQQFVDLHYRRQGFFDQHYYSSIPYRLEEEYRMAYALLRYAQQSPENISFYSLGTAEGTMARTLSELSAGKIQSLSCSPNEENYNCFNAFGTPAHAEFFLGPFHHLTQEVIRTKDRLARFSSGFDFILEDTTFQMYSPNRPQQIQFVAQHLKEDGIFLFIEKFRAADDQDYDAREAQKDFGFKMRYFGREQIERKAQTVLNTMHKSEVHLTEMASAVYACFRHCVVTWNSGNFYGLAACNSETKLSRYLSLLPCPAIPHEYVYSPVPYCELRAAADDNNDRESGSATQDPS